MTLNDLHTVMMWFSPEWIHPAAERFGTGGDKVLGAVLAFDEARKMAREYIRYVRWRDSTTARDLKIALLFRAAGYSPGLRERRHVLPLPENDWRETATGWLWPTGPGLIPGAVKVPVGAHSQAEVNRAATLAISQMLARNPGLNRAVLDGRVWQRRTAEVMVHVSLRGERIRSTIMDCSEKDVQWLQKRLRRALRSMVRAERHEFVEGVTAANVGVQMLRAWMGKFIASPAGAMVSFAPRVPQGWAALVPNGIPLAFTVCEVRDGECWITATIDHRALDGESAGLIYADLEGAIPRILEEGK